MRLGRWGRSTAASASVENRVIYQAASLCLQYPDDELLGRLPLLTSALADVSLDGGALRGVVEHLSTTDPELLRTEYIELFDLSRRQTLYLTYWSDGDTRRRGSALAAIKQTYRECDFVVDTGGELPDYLPMVLEFAARVDIDSGRGLLQEHRASLELIRLALHEKESPYADVLAAVCATLPGTSPSDKATALAMRTSSPAVERVGLDTGDPRLLPLYTASEMTVMTRTAPMRNR